MRISSLYQKADAHNSEAAYPVRNPVSVVSISSLAPPQELLRQLPVNRTCLTEPAMDFCLYSVNVADDISICRIYILSNRLHRYTNCGVTSPPCIATITSIVI